MAAIPILEESAGSPTTAMIDGLVGAELAAIAPSTLEAMPSSSIPRKLAIYPASAGFDLANELDFLSARSIEPNVFFNPRFLVPAMPRLEDRDVSLAVIRDGDEYKSRLRLLTPFSIERPAVPFGIQVLRTWSSPFGPLGTPLVDCDDPMGVVEDFFSMLARPHLRLPRVIVMPELRLDGPFVAMLGTLAESRRLPMKITSRLNRPYLESDLEGEAYLRQSLRAHHFRDFRRLKRKLGEHGEVVHQIARQPEDIREGIETFLLLEAAGWKGRQRTAMAVDRFRAAFVREAAYRLAERDLCRVHSLTVGGKPVASLVVFVESGIAYTWKTAYDEAYASYSPGTLLMIEVTCKHLEDPNIEATDSCAMPDHPVMSRLWRERRPVGTVVMGLKTGSEKLVQQAEAQLNLHRNSLDLARRVRKRVKKVLARR